MKMKNVDPRTLETALRRRATACGYTGDFIPRRIIDEVIGKERSAIMRTLNRYEVPRMGAKSGRLYQINRVAEAFAK